MSLQVLPVVLDVGTNRQELQSDPSYMGVRRPRDRSAAYDKLVAEFFDSCQAEYGKDVLIQVGGTWMYIMYTKQLWSPVLCCVYW